MQQVVCCAWDDDPLGQVLLGVVLVGQATALGGDHHSAAMWWGLGREWVIKLLYVGYRGWVTGTTARLCVGSRKGCIASAARLY